MAMQPEIRYINTYVSGNVAYQPKKKPQKHQFVQLPKVRKQQKLVIPVDMLAEMRQIYINARYGGTATKADLKRMKQINKELATKD